MSKLIKLGRNDLCYCGSGEKYKNCHLFADQNEGKKAYKEYVTQIKTRQELKRKTLQFIDFIKDLFGIVYDPTSWAGSILGGIDDERIKILYKELPNFFPHDKDFQHLYRDISKNPFSGILWASPSINTIATYLTRYCLYTPHVIVLNPFLDMMLYHLDASPLDNPAPWKQVTVNQSLFLVTLEPWIKEGFVTAIPPIRWFDHDFFVKKIKPIAEEWLEHQNEHGGESEWSSQFMLEILKNFHPRDAEAILRSMFHDVPDEFVQLTKQILETEFQKNPIRYLWSGNKSSTSIMKFGAGNNLQATLLTADLCGSYILLGEDQYRNQFDRALKRGEKNIDEPLTQLSRAFSEVEFQFLNAVSLDFALNIRRDGRMSELRNYLIKVFDDISALNLDQHHSYQVFRDELDQQYRQFKEEWKDIDKKLAKEFIKTAVGTGIAVLSGQFGFQVAAGGLATFGLQGLFQASESRKLQKRKPLAIFHDLERKLKRKR